MILIEHHVMVKVNNISRFFRDEIEIFSNLVVRDKIKICFFYISCFETRSRICFATSRISRRGRETKQLILEVEREFSMLILARHLEIENSRQCLAGYVGILCAAQFYINPGALGLPTSASGTRRMDACLGQRKLIVEIPG